MCHQLTTLKDTVVLTEAFAEAGTYLIPKAWKGDKVRRKDQGDHSTQRGKGPES